MSLESKLQDCLKKCRLELENEKLCFDENLSFEDKNGMAEFVLNTALHSIENVLSFLGFQNANVLVFRCSTDCEFKQERVKEQESPAVRIGHAITEKTVTTIREHVWIEKIDFSFVCAGAVIKSNTITREIVTMTKTRPKPIHVEHDPLSISLPTKRSIRYSRLLF